MAAYLMHLRRRKVRVFQKRHDPLVDYDDIDVYRRFRFHKGGLIFLREEFCGPLERPTKRNHALTTTEMLCLTLRFYAGGPHQRIYGDTIGISQAATCKAMWGVTEEIVRKADDFIYLPVAEELADIKAKFFELAGFPNVIGLIDGTHIRIIAPSAHEEAYVNRKGFHSVNCQIVVDSNGLIRNINICEGSRHDSRILQTSTVWEAYEGGVPGNSVVLGDSGYPCRHWLLTPFINPAEEQLGYNRAHKTTRAMVERVIGSFKRVFSCLHQELRFSPDKCSKVVMAAAVLYNIRKRMGIHDEDDQLDGGLEDEQDVEDGALGGDAPMAMRQHYVERYFT